AAPRRDPLAPGRRARQHPLRDPQDQRGHRHAHLGHVARRGRPSGRNRADALGGRTHERSARPGRPVAGGGVSARATLLLAVALAAALSGCVWPATSVDPARAAFATNPQAADLALLEYRLEKHFAGAEARSLTTCATVVAGERGAVPFRV